MLRFATTIFVLLFCYSVSAQTNQEFEIFVNGNLEKIAMGKKNIFITSKGDTIVYKVDDIIKEMVKDQPKVSNTGATATNYKQPESEKMQEKAVATSVQEKTVVKATENVVVVKPVEQKAEQKVIEKAPVVAEKKEPVKLVTEQKPTEIPKQEKVIATEVQQKQVQVNPPVVTKTEPVKEAPKQNVADQSEIERLKEEARKKIKGTTNETVAKTVPETKTQNTVEEPEKKNVVAEKVNQPVKTEKAVVKAAVVEVEKKNVAEAKLVQPVKAEKKEAAGVVEVEQKKVTEEKNVRYVNKKYYLENRDVTSSNISSTDTLKFVATFLSAYKDFPSLQFGEEGDFSLCYNYVVKMYNGYDEDLVAKNSSVYKICHSGKWNDGKKTAEVYMETSAGRKKINYSIVQLDDKILVLVKR
jgi:chemotaxis protein histidine kinase CheA